MGHLTANPNNTPPCRAGNCFFFTRQRQDDAGPDARGAATGAGRAPHPPCCPHLPAHRPPKRFPLHRILPYPIPISTRNLILTSFFKLLQRANFLFPRLHYLSHICWRFCLCKLISPPPAALSVLPSPASQQVSPGLNCSLATSTFADKLPPSWFPLTATASHSTPSQSW